MTLPAGFPLSKPASTIPQGSRFDLVVVGSGYGGAVVAYRAALAKKTVCILERGQEFLPQAWTTDMSPAPPNYPNTLFGVWNETQMRTDAGTFAANDAQGPGLFDLHLGDDVSVLVGCGLGGTSLINANVALRPDLDVFKEPPWPKAIGSDPRLSSFFDEAERRLGSNPYPSGEDGYPKLHKVAALEAAAAAIGKPFARPPINVTFAKKTNVFGVPQEACVLCGDCVTGCNYGAKNTTLMNYLPGAKQQGAVIYTCASVTSISANGGGWTVNVSDLASKTSPAVTITASAVVLAAGTLGSTEILWRSKTDGLAVSEKLGTRFSTNGDALAWGYDTDWQGHDAGPLAALSGQRQPIYGVGAGSRLTPSPGATMPTEPWLRPGPCIAGVIDARKKDRLPEESGCIIEEGVIPGAFAQVAPAMAFLGDALAGDYTRYADGRQRLQDAQELGTAIREDAGNIGDQAYRGPMSRTQSYLVMSRDDAGGTLAFEADRLHVRWPGAGKERVFRDDDRTLQKVNQVLRGNFLPDPLWSEAAGRQLITVHPLGGCPMADSGAFGVVNEQGRVFTGAGADVYPSLFVCDGSVIPTALGVNPLLTITALAERTAEFVVQQLGAAPAVDAPAPPPVAAAAGAGAKPASFELPRGTEEQVLLQAFVFALKPWLRAEAKATVTAAIATLPSSGDAIDATAKQKLEDEEVERLMADVGTRFVQPLVKTAVSLAQAVEQKLPTRPELQAAVAAQTLRLVERIPAGFSPSFSFSEEMRGWISAAPLPHLRESAATIADPFEVASRYGEAEGADAFMVAALAITTDDLHFQATQPLTPMTEQQCAAYDWKITGRVTCPALSPEPLQVVPSGSHFRLLTADADRVETWVMTYHLELATAAGLGTATLDGTKILHRRSGSTPWTDLTTLYVTAQRPGKPDMRGILRLGVQDIAAQAASMTATLNPGGILGLLAQKLGPLGAPLVADVGPAVSAYFQAELAGFFAEAVMRAYGGLLADLENFPATDDAARTRRALQPPTLLPELHPLGTADGAEIQLTRYHLPKGKLPPVILAPGFMTSAASFAADTVDTNIVEYLHAKGYDVWLLDYRGSPALAAPAPFSIDDLARYDWPAAVSYVCAVANRPQVHVIAHCVGSLSFLMALLRPEAAAPGGLCSRIAPSICSQTTLHPVSNWLNGVKIDLDVLGIMQRTFGVEQIDFRSSPTAASEMLDTFLWSVPVPAGEECVNPLCHRVFSLFGPSWAHAQLNAATHDALCEWFGNAYATPLAQLTLIMKQRRAVDRHGRDVYLPHHANLASVPLTFIAGELNQIFTQESSLITLEWLRQVNPTGNYARKVFQGYAHMDTFIGRSAATDIFPYLVGALGAG